MPTVTTQVTDELRRLLAEDRTWTSRQLAQALAGRGITLGARQVRRHLKRLGARYRRTAIDAQAQAGPGQGRARRPRPGQPQGEGGRRLELMLYYRDKCGFSPTLPVGYSWGLPEQRKIVRYEAPQGRRVNALAAYRPYGGSPRLEVFTAERTWDAYDLLGFLELPLMMPPLSQGIGPSGRRHAILICESFASQPPAWEWSTPRDA